ncbi:hypothetical protein KQX54_016743 [Cotesia glomerata]|uniref:Ubiquitin-like protease family profile domain-containing protein n=1 Tax=Cotesia glomerata TaxID=32391 RepID=A0AAV7IQS1_COTGL|nr:hypothetical protein KQX54_016743 [Cotesia glomerata]
MYLMFWYVKGKVCRKLQENNENLVKENTLSKCELVNDVNYYANTKSLIIVIAYDYPTTENFILKKEMTMNGKQLRNLLYRRGSVDAETIDIFAAMNADKINEKYYTKNNTSCGTILIPYCEHEHWILLVVSKTEKSIEILDPYNREKDPTKITNALKSYINKCNRQLNIKSMIAANWIVKIPQDQPLQKLTDKFNSAVYIMYYTQCIGQNLEMNETLDPEKYRETIIHFIMEHSLGLEDKCIYCFRAIDTEKHIVCIMCHRQVHNKCRRLDGMDTEDEEKVEYHEPPKKKICSKNKGENYKCRLCRR